MGPNYFCTESTKVPFVLAKSKVHQISRAWVTNEWKGQRFKKIYVRKITQHEEMFFKLSFKGMIRFDLNMEHDEVYGKFVLTVCICSILYFCKKFADCKKIDSASLFTRGIRLRILY